MTEMCNMCTEEWISNIFW